MAEMSVVQETHYTTVTESYLADYISRKDPRKPSLTTNLPNIKAAYSFEVYVSTDLQYKKLEVSEIENWASSSHRIETDLDGFEAGFKFIILETDQGQNCLYEDIKSEHNPNSSSTALRDTILHVADIFGIGHIAWDRQLSGLQVFSSGPYSTRSNEQSFWFRANFNTWHATWRFDIERQISLGILSAELPGCLFEDLVEDLKILVDDFRGFFHLPLFSALIHFAINLRILRKEVEDSLARVRRLEQVTRHGYLNPSAGLDLETLTGANLNQLSADAVTLTNQCALTTRLLRCMLRDLNLILEHKPSIVSFQGTSVELAALHEQAVAMYSLADSLFLKAERYQLLASNQLEALKILIPGRDQNHMRRDNSAIMTLARVAIVFLPPTFIAALFQAFFPNQSGHFFKLFWAWAIPVTIVTMITAYLLNRLNLYLSHRRDKRHLERTFRLEQGWEAN